MAKNNIIIENIKKIRKIYNLTQKELAEKLHVGRSTIALIENGRSTPTNQTIYNICREFGIRREWLTRGIPPMKKKDEDIIREAIDKINNIDAARKAFLKVFEELTDNKDKKDDFYKIIDSLHQVYEKSDRDTKGYLTVQLKKTFPEYIIENNEDKTKD